MTSPYRVWCREEAKSYQLTPEQYSFQMSNVNSLWRCPNCGAYASWDDMWYETALAIQQCLGRPLCNNEKQAGGFLVDGTPITVCVECPLFEFDFEDLKGEEYSELLTWALEV